MRNLSSSTATPMAAALLAGLFLAGCSKAPAPAPAEPDKKATAPEDAGHHELKNAIEARDYREKAKAAGDPVLEADKRHEQELKDAGG